MRKCQPRRSFIGIVGGTIVIAGFIIVFSDFEELGRKLTLKYLTKNIPSITIKDLQTAKTSPNSMKKDLEIAKTSPSSIKSDKQTAKTSPSTTKSDQHTAKPSSITTKNDQRIAKASSITITNDQRIEKAKLNSTIPKDRGKISQFLIRISTTKDGRHKINEQISSSQVRKNLTSKPRRVNPMKTKHLDEQASENLRENKSRQQQRKTKLILLWRELYKTVKVIRGHFTQVCPFV